MKKYIVAIDTGSDKSAFVMYNKETKQLADRHWLPNIELIERLRKYYSSGEVELVLIEMSASYGMPIGIQVLINCLIIGMFAQLAKQYNLPVKLIFRKTIKLELCGALRKVNDSAVNITIRDMYWGDPGSKSKKNLNPFYFNEETDKNEARSEMENNQWAALGILTSYLNNPKCVDYNSQKELSKMDAELIEYLEKVN